MKEIALTRGKVALVDDDQYDELSKYKWHATEQRHTFYAMRSGPRGNWKRETICMHRQILNPPAGCFMDHINGNGLDNQRKNLRICTNSQNLANRGVAINNLIGYKGVVRCRKKFRAGITHNGKVTYLGTFDCRLAAAYAYDAAARKRFGEFARTNF